MSKTTIRAVVLWGQAQITPNMVTRLRRHFKLKDATVGIQYQMVDRASLNSNTLYISGNKPSFKSGQGVKVLNLQRAIAQLPKRTKAKKSANQVPAAPAIPVAKLPAVRQTTKMAFMLDCSGSMSGITEDVKKLFAQNLAAARSSVTANNDLYVSVYYFDDQLRKKHLNAPVHSLSSDLPGYGAFGGTRLYDTIQEVAKQIVSPNDDPKTTAYAIMMLTDGRDEGSTTPAMLFKQFVLDKQATDRWTFTFLLPPGQVSHFISATGVHPGNVQGWTNVDNAAKEQSVGIQSYLATRGTGKAAVQTFFVNAPTAKELAKLPTLTGAKLWNVDKEAVIQPFVESKGLVFAPGQSYYLLMKREKVQDYKNMLIVEKGTKDIKADARKLLGLPASGTVAVKPGDFGKYEIYVQSNSHNRILPRGTKLIYLPV